MKKNFVGSLVAALLLAGCGGGGGSSSGGSGASVPPTEPITPQSVAVQRQEADTSLAALQSAILISEFQPAVASPTSSAAGQSGAVRNVGSGIHALDESLAAGAFAGLYFLNPGDPGAVTQPNIAITCTNGLEDAPVPVSTTEVTLYQISFYDNACTSIFQSEYADVVLTNGTTASGTGNVTTYNASGSVATYNAFTVNETGLGTSSQLLRITSTQAANSAATPYENFGIGCALTGSATSSSTVSTASCGTGVVTHDSALNADAAVLFSAGSALAVSGSSGNASLTITSAMGSAYTGSLDALTLAPATALPYFSVTNGTRAITSTYAGSVGLTTYSALSSASFTEHDTTNDASVTVTTQTSPSTQFQGTIAAAGSTKTLATFTVDVNGNGTITYGNGTTGTIANFAVQS